MDDYEDGMSMTEFIITSSIILMLGLALWNRDDLKIMFMDLHPQDTNISIKPVQKPSAPSAWDSNPN